MSNFRQRRSPIQHHLRGWKHRYHTHYLRPNHILLQFCVLLLSLAYILISSLLLLQPHNLSSRPHSRLRLHQYLSLQSKKTPRPKYATRQRAGLKGGSVMSITRVATVSFDSGTNTGHEITSSRRAELPTEESHTTGTLQLFTSLHEHGVNASHNSNNRPSDCKPMAKWQSMIFPTCNSLHEMNTFASSLTLSYFDPRRHARYALQFHRFPRQQVKSFPISDTYSARILGNGWFRHAWEVTDWSHGTRVAIKTLRPQREFVHEYYELHRRDAVAMERLTQSPYIMDIFGHCGQSSVTEIAFDEQGISNLYRLSAGLRGIDTSFVLKSKLQIAAMTSLAVGHMHSVGIDLDGDTENVLQHPPATIAHNDINPRNVIMAASGIPKLNDFNLAEFLTRTEALQPCGFQSRLHEPWWRAPEEMVFYDTITADETVEVYPKTMISEKADIYSLGNTLFVLLTGIEPRGKEHKQQRYKSVSNMVARGEYPSFGNYANSSDPAVSAICEAIRSCWERDPTIRPTAMEIAHGLFAAFDQLEHT